VQEDVHGGHRPVGLVEHPPEDRGAPVEQELVGHAVGGRRRQPAQHGGLVAGRLDDHVPGAGLPIEEEDAHAPMEGVAGVLLQLIPEAGVVREIRGRQHVHLETLNRQAGVQVDHLAQDAVGTHGFWWLLFLGLEHPGLVIGGLAGRRDRQHAPRSLRDRGRNRQREWLARLQRRLIGERPEHPTEQGEHRSATEGREQSIS